MTFFPKNPGSHFSPLCLFSFLLFSVSLSAQVVRIHDIQGDGESAQRLGEQLIIEGVVTQIRNGSRGFPDGFFVQEEDSDRDENPGTSEGIFVYAPDGIQDIRIANKVRVKGEVVEYNQLTELVVEVPAEADRDSFLRQAIQIVENRINLPDPALFKLPVENLSDFEALEGMRVVFDQPLLITDLYELGLYNSFIAATELLRIPTDYRTPPAGDGRNLKSKIIIDDGSNERTPEKIRFFNHGNSVRRGTRLWMKGITGVLSEAFNAYRINIPANVNIPVTGIPSRPAVPHVGGRLQVATFNVLNLFSTLDADNNRCGPLQDDCRGARTIEQLELQLSKLSAAIIEMDAEVICLQELENPIAGNPTLELLIQKINSTLGEEAYQFVATGPVGPDVIKVGIIYNKKMVQPEGSAALLDQVIDPNFDENLNRAALAQTFRELGSNSKFTVVVNHLKSKGGSQYDPQESAPNDNDQNDGQGFYSFTRSKAAQALADWIETDPTSSGDPDYLLVGDMNSYAMEDPIRIFEENGFQNILKTQKPKDAYTFVYFGQEGQLDYILSNSAVSPQITGAAAWHINADEAFLLSYFNDERARLLKRDVYRCSDHDPVIVGLNLMK